MILFEVKLKLKRYWKLTVGVVLLLNFLFIYLEVWGEGARIDGTLNPSRFCCDYR